MIMSAKTCLTKLNLEENFLVYFWNIFIVSQILKLTNLDKKEMYFLNNGFVVDNP